MKLVRRRVLLHDVTLQNISTGPVVAKVSGSIKKLSEVYRDSIVVLYNKANLLPITAQKPDQDGNYQFMGLNTDLKTFIVAFDQKQEYNAVIQDNVVPK